MFKKMNEACDRFEERVYESPLLTTLFAFLVIGFFWAATWFLAALLT